MVRSAFVVLFVAAAFCTRAFAQDTVSLTHPASGCTLVFFEKEGNAFIFCGKERADVDLWELGTSSLQPASNRVADLKLAVDKTSAVQFVKEGDNTVITKWRITRQKEGRCTFQVDEGPHKGWYLAAADVAAKRKMADGTEVTIYPLVILRTANKRCEFEVAEVSR